MFCYIGIDMSTSRLKSIIISEASRKKSKRDPAGQEDSKVTLSQEEITKLSDYLRLSNH